MRSLPVILLTVVPFVDYVSWFLLFWFQFQDMVKPYYSNVDLLEVELLDNETSAREFPTAFKALRKFMIDGGKGWTERHLVRQHMDGMVRVLPPKYTQQLYANVELIRKFFDWVVLMFFSLFWCLEASGHEKEQLLLWAHPKQRVLVGHCSSPALRRV